MFHFTHSNSKDFSFLPTTAVSNNDPVRLNSTHHTFFFLARDFVLHLIWSLPSLVDVLTNTLTWLLFGTTRFEHPANHTESSQLSSSFQHWFSFLQHAKLCEPCKEVDHPQQAPTEWRQDWNSTLWPYQIFWSSWCWLESVRVIYLFAILPII